MEDNMFKKIINKLTGNKKNSNKNSSASSKVDVLNEIESVDLPSNVIRFNDYVEKKKLKNTSKEVDFNQGVDSENDRKLEMEERKLKAKKKELELKKKELELLDEKINLSDKVSVNNALEEKHCLECSASLLTRGKRSAVSDSNKYMYICCSDCGCIIKLKNDGTLVNTKNILKEVSDAYNLFKKVNINPQSYAYTKNGERHKF